MTRYNGIARCRMIKRPIELGGGLAPDMLRECTWKRCPHGLVVPAPDPSAPECLVEFCTEGDRLAELEAHAGILHIFEYGEIA